MDTKELLKLIEAVKDSDFSEFILEEQDLKLTLRRSGSEQSPPPAVTSNPPGPRAPVSQPREKGLVEVLAPMVGTFYRAPSPEAKPFVSPGTRVQAGDTLCILEAMKLMNEIVAEISGEVVAIAAENGQLVEYGQVLLTICPQQP